VQQLRGKIQIYKKTSQVYGWLIYIILNKIEILQAGKNSCQKFLTTTFFGPTRFR
jgi:hypothetical protein